MHECTIACRPRPPHVTVLHDGWRRGRSREGGRRVRGRRSRAGGRSDDAGCRCMWELLGVQFCDNPRRLGKVLACSCGSSAQQSSAIRTLPRNSASPALALESDKPRNALITASRSSAQSRRPLQLAGKVRQCRGSLWCSAPGQEPSQRTALGSTGRPGVPAGLRTCGRAHRCRRGAVNSPHAPRMAASEPAAAAAAAAGSPPPALALQACGPAH